MVNDKTASSADAILDQLRAEAPARYFATLFLPAPLRSQISVLHMYDLRLLSVQAAGDEVHPALIKLAWWRDAIAGLGHQAVRGEPLLGAIQDRIPADALQDWAALADAHMDRVEHGDADAVVAARERAAAATLGHGRLLRSMTALRIADRMKERSLLRLQLAMTWHIITGHN